MRVKVLFLLILFASATGMFAAEPYGASRLEEISNVQSQMSNKTSAYQGFSGGMMLHTGYLFGIDKAAPAAPDGRSYSQQGALYGIGGALRVHLWKHLRTGFEGFVSTMPSGLSDQSNVLKTGSYTRIGCGGVNADACWRLEKAWPYIGAAIGGGAMRSLFMLDGDLNTWDKQADTYFHKQSFFYVTPYVGCDYCLTKKLHLTFRFDWMLAVHRNELVLPTGPRLYFGLMFCH